MYFILLSIDMWSLKTINTSLVLLNIALLLIKVTLEEQDGVPHHMMNILDPDSLSYTIHNYKSQATAIIQDILDRDRLPIVVGGTNYYVDCLLWESLIPSPQSQSAASTG